MEYPAARLPPGGDGELPVAAWLVPGRRSRGVHPRRARSRRSRSRGSAAATRCSTPRSSTGSTSSTSCGCRSTIWRRAWSRSSATRACGGRSWPGTEREWFGRVLALVRPRVRRLDQFVEELRPFLDEQVSVRPVRGREASRQAGGRGTRSTALPGTLAGLDPFTQRALEAALRALAEANGVKAAALIHATRVAVTGRAVSPGLFEVLELLGRDRSSARLREALRLLPQ